MRNYDMGGGIRYDSDEYIEGVMLGRNSDGGPGSGDWGHSGRPGKVGGSGGGGGKEHRTGSKSSGYSSTAKEHETKTGSGGSGGSGSSGSSGKNSESGSSKVDVKRVSQISRNEAKTEWEIADEEDRLAYIDDARDEYSGYEFTRNGKLANAIAAEEGLDSTPTSLSGKDFDEYVKQTGSKVIYRGVENFESEEGDVFVSGADLRKEFSMSDNATYGGGNYGSGYHFSDDKSYAEGFAKKNNGGELFECAIKPGASFMKHSMWESLPDRIKSQYDNDEGLYALTHGFDGISSTTGVTNIVNRGALVYKDPGQ